MKLNYSKLGNYIKESKLKNKDSSETNLVGLSNEKKFTASKANISGTDLSNYKIISHNQFVYTPTTSRNGDKISIALFKEKGGIISSSYTVFGIDSNLLNPDYLMLWFERPEFDRYARYHSHGSVREIFSWEDMENIELYVPPIEHQNKVVIIKNLMDNRISIITQINKNLEQLLRTVFNYWFISFGKFKNLEFTQTILGDIPEGWECGSLRELLTLTKNPIKANETNGLPYLPIDIIPMNSLGISELKSDDEAKTSLITFDKNDILIGAMRVYFHRVVVSPCSGVTRSTCFVLKPKKEEYLSYLLLLCNLNQTIQYAQNTSKGTTMPYAVWDNGLGDMDIIIPPESVLNEFHELVFPIIEKIRDSYNKINKLQRLRDTLLPRLMSGEIDVSKINYDLEV